MDGGAGALLPGPIEKRRAFFLARQSAAWNSLPEHIRAEPGIRGVRKLQDAAF